MADDYPNMKFNKEGLCSYCETYNDHLSSVIDLKAGFPGETALKNDLLQVGVDSSEILVCLSGGKDSTFMLKALQNLGFTPIAFVFDNGYLSAYADRNIENITTKLGIELIIEKPHKNLMNQLYQLALTKLISVKEGNVFRKGVVDFGPLCYICGCIYMPLAFKIAVEREIPFVGTGYSPGQDIPSQLRYHRDVTDQNAPYVLKAQIPPVNYRPKFAQASDLMDSYFPMYKFLKNEIDASELEKFFLFTKESLQKVQVFRFYDYVHYNEHEIVSEIEKLGWVRPPDTGNGSTNCRLDPVATMVHEQKFKFFRHSVQLSSLVRVGLMDRSYALSLFTDHEYPEDSKTILAELTQAE